MTTKHTRIGDLFFEKRLSWVNNECQRDRNLRFSPALSVWLSRRRRNFLQDKAPQLGAALAYYTVFSLAPLILVLLAIVGVIFRDDPAGAWDKITQQMSYFLDASAVSGGAKHRAESIGNLGS